MNIALPALLIFLVFLPGFIFRSRYRRVERTSLDYSPFGEAVASGVVFAAGLHAIWLLISYWLFGRTLDLGVLLVLTGADAGAQREAVAAVRGDQWWILSYFVTIVALPYALAPAVRWLMEKLSEVIPNHRLGRLFQFNAPWYNLLYARSKRADIVVIAAVVDVAGSPYLYMGTLVQFFVTPDGNLDRLVLENVSRRPLSRDKTVGNGAVSDNESRFYPIDGDYFVLRYSEAITLNVHYLLFRSPPPAPDGPHAGVD